MANITPIRKEKHQNIKVAAQRDLSHVANQHIAPITAPEYSQAATSYPVIIVKDQGSERYRSVVMLGLEAGENLYHKEGSWNAVYIPQSISMAPFSLGVDPDKEKTLTACIDLDSKFVGEDKEHALFDEEGNDTEFSKNVQDSLGRLYDNEVMNEKFIKELVDNDLLLELELHINLASGETKKLIGLYGIDEKKVQALSDEQVLDFHKRGLFIPIHAMLGSAGQINRLAQLRNLSESTAKVNAIRFSPVTVDEEK
ncbi:SapC protein [Colwellia chukchiensis]|uniref:SapC protein n=1 Tax=Colwellia chukchiensis TaxID=641665 RepID=A0A1H7PAZ4_9GAMM|nr:SapC family protein [Colwellia chukchiensis]SEL32980.1 SapC protein [Colwellia chukchiensis]